jgi:sterol 3beta-glucosyltransferase
MSQPELILQLVAMNKQLVDPHDTWGPQYQFTGFWHPIPQPTWCPPSDLRHFVESDPPPVVATMGSMVMFDPDQFLDRITQIARRAGRRVLVITSWSGVIANDLPEYVMCAPEVPYEWLFPRASCVIHHGGCGTVAAVLRAGKPSILLPQITSQEQFAEILKRNNLLAGMFGARNLLVDELAGAIERAMSDQELQHATRMWRDIISAENGVERCADLIEEHAARVV